MSCFDSLFGGKSIETPFERVLALDVYAGPVRGVAFCRDRREAYLFRLLAWDSQQENRIFSLSAVPVQSVDRLIAFIAQFESPRWPEWWVRGGFGDEGLAKLDAEIMSLEREAAPVDVIVMSKNLLQHLRVKRLVSAEQKGAFERLSVRSPTSAEVTDAPFAEWVAFLDEPDRLRPRF